MTERADRTCATCACYHLQTSPVDPNMRQGFCRLNPPMHARGKVEVPRLDINKNVVMGRDGQPIMETQEKDFYIYPPTLPELTCFAHWRPLELQPGDKWNPDYDAMKTAIEGAINMAMGAERATRN